MLFHMQPVTRKIYSDLLNVTKPYTTNNSLSSLLTSSKETTNVLFALPGLHLNVLKTEETLQFL